MNGVPVFLQWGVVQISLANVVVIGLMLVLFVLALVIPFPDAKDSLPAGEIHDERS
jgi:hypothetical protein